MISSARGEVSMSLQQTKTRSLLPIVLLVLSIPIAGCAAAPSTRNEDSKFPVAPFRLESAPWSEPYTGPLWVPKGARRAVLWTDPKTGGDTYYAHFPAGTRFEPHWHAYAEFAVVLRGKVIHTIGTEKSSLDVGDYVVIPPRVAHGWDSDPGGDAFLLIRRDGPADQNFVQR